jgi:anthranilate/para-aminobenzoate synthase component I
MDGFYGKIKSETPADKTAWDCFRAIFPKPTVARK